MSLFNKKFAIQSYSPKEYPNIIVIELNGKILEGSAGNKQIDQLHEAINNASESRVVVDLTNTIYTYGNHLLNLFVDVQPTLAFVLGNGCQQLSGFIPRVSDHQIFNTLDAAICGVSGNDKQNNNRPDEPQENEQ